VHVYLIVDLECISGVSNGGMVRVGSADWASRGRHLATADVNAAVEGALAAGAARIYVRDSHDNGENLVREELHSAAELISGSAAVTPYLPDIDGFDAVFLMGFHARMGTHRGFYDHTVTTATISEIRLNGTPVGEIGLYGAYAGLRGIPVTLITGDVAAVAEARELFGPIQGVAVGEGYGRFAARLRAPEVTRPEIRAAAEAALSDAGRPWRLGTPLHVGMDFLRSAEADMAEMVPGARRTSARTVEYRHDDPEMTFKAIQAMIKLGGIAASRWASALYTTGSRVT
jgi:D-amino peptidase